MVLRMGRDDTTMTVQSPRAIWDVIRDRTAMTGREDLTGVIEDALATAPADKETIRITADIETATALYAASRPAGEEG